MILSLEAPLSFFFPPHISFHDGRLKPSLRVGTEVAWIATQCKWVQILHPFPPSAWQPKRNRGVFRKPCCALRFFVRSKCVRCIRNTIRHFWNASPSRRKCTLAEHALCVWMLNDPVCHCICYHLFPTFTVFTFRLYTFPSLSTFALGPHTHDWFMAMIWLRGGK